MALAATAAGDVQLKASRHQLCVWRLSLATRDDFSRAARRTLALLRGQWDELSQWFRHVSTPSSGKMRSAGRDFS